MADGFEQVELTEPKKALEEAGAQAEIISPGTKTNGFSAGCRGPHTPRQECQPPAYFW